MLNTKLRLMQMALDDTRKFQEIHRADIEGLVIRTLDSKDETINVLKTMLGDTKSENTRVGLELSELQERINSRVLPSTRQQVAVGEKVEIRTRSPKWSEKASELERKNREAYWRDKAHRVDPDSLGAVGGVSVGPSQAPTESGSNDQVGSSRGPGESKPSGSGAVQADSGRSGGEDVDVQRDLQELNAD